MAAGIASLCMGSGVARADTYTLTFTGLDDLSGTDFTYTSNSPVTLNTVFAPTTSTDLFVLGADEGKLTEFQFGNRQLSFSAPTVDFGINIDQLPDLTQSGVSTITFSNTHGGGSLGTLSISVPEIDTTSGSALTPLALLAASAPRTIRTEKET